MKKLVVCLLLFALVITGCGAAGANQVDYEAEALRKAQEDWASRSETDPLSTYFKALMGESQAANLEISVLSHGRFYAAQSVGAFVFLPSDVSLDSELLKLALAEESDPDAKERILAELQWGHPKQLTARNPEDPEDTVSFDYSYDDAGRVSRVQANLGEDGGEDISFSCRYDEKGFLLEKRIESGENAFERINTYDEEGRLIRSDMNCNGVSASCQWEYDRYGNPALYKYVLDEQTTWIRVTWNEQGMPVLVESVLQDGALCSSLPRWESDENGFSLRLEVYGNAIDCSGSYDEGHRVLTYVRDVEKMVTTVSNQYGESGGLLRSSSEAVASGEIARTDRTVTSYNLYGGVVSMTTSTEYEENQYSFDNSSRAFVFHHDDYGRCDSITVTMGGESYTLELAY